MQRAGKEQPTRSQTGEQHAWLGVPRAYYSKAEGAGGLSWMHLLCFVICACILPLLCHAEELQGTPRHSGKIQSILPKKPFPDPQIPQPFPLLQFRAAMLLSPTLLTLAPLPCNQFQE